MKVRELIEKLKSFPEEMEVLASGAYAAIGEIYEVEFDTDKQGKEPSSVIIVTDVFSG